MVLLVVGGGEGGRVEGEAASRSQGDVGTCYSKVMIQLNLIARVGLGGSAT